MNLTILTEETGVSDTVGSNDKDGKEQALVPLFFDRYLS